MLFCNFPAKVSAAGASLYLTPSTGTFVIGGTFSVSVKVSTGGQVINAAEGAIQYDSSLLEAVSASRGGAVFNLWTTEPTISGGAIRFGGGIPMPGYKGNGGHVMTVKFKAKAAGTAQVSFTSGAVLANDGKGTNILASMGSGSYTISPKVDAPKSEEPTSTKTSEAKTTKTQEEKEIEREYNKPIIKSSTHPDSNKWYGLNSPKFSWELSKNITGVSVLLNREPVSDPGPKSDGLVSEKEYKDLEDGLWYFHLKFYDDKKWGTVEHYRIMVDTRPPKPFEIKVGEIIPGEWPEIFFETMDEDSGLDAYEVNIGSLESQTHNLGADKKSLKLENLSIGDHIAMITAVDKAGNQRISKVEFYIKPIDAPKILNYNSNFESGDNFYMSGSSVDDSSVIAYIEKEGKIISSSTVASQDGGDWFYIDNNKLNDGRYVAWAEAINKNGIKSEPSNRISFLVSPPIFMMVGKFVIDYFSLLVSLLFMIILIIFLALYITSKIRKKLKKETIEAEDVLRKNIEVFNNEIDEEFERLKKFEGNANYKKEKQKSKENLKQKAGEIEKRIMKEVKDVENILK